ncbi:MAG: hypothetical protein LBS65_07740 [Desulfovibrio sp.]|nr:hypothetical protein [Desulfovibrio sp.]
MSGAPRLYCRNRREGRKAKKAAFALLAPPAAARPASPGVRSRDRQSNFKVKLPQWAVEKIFRSPEYQGNNNKIGGKIKKKSRENQEKI